MRGDPGTLAREFSDHGCHLLRWGKLEVKARMTEKFNSSVERGLTVGAA